jgi:beta-phosphoglucomutase
MLQKPQAIFFDMDGVIIDSMPYHFIAWYEALRKYNVTVNSFDIYQKEGEPWNTTLPYFLDRDNIPYTKELVEEIFAYRQKIFKKYYKRFIFDDAEKLIMTLHQKKYKLGLVSGTPSYDIKKLLPTSIYNLFDVIIGGENVCKGKPDPEPYLKAAQKVGVDPAQCIVIENAPLGIRSAKAAGMYCYAITTSLPKEYLGQADQIVQSLKEISI